MQKFMNFINFKKNGMPSNDTEILFFDKKKEEEFKRNLTIKTILCLILTNVFTYIACHEGSETKTFSSSKDMTILSIPLENFVPSTYGKNEVTLLGPNNQVLASNAIIEDQLEKVADIEDKEINFYLVSIKNEDIDKLVGMENKVIRAYPKSIKPKSAIAQTGGPYEINF